MMRRLQILKRKVQTKAKKQQQEETARMTKEQRERTAAGLEAEFGSTDFATEVRGSTVPTGFF